MTTIELTLEDSQIDFLEQCQSYGFKNKSEAIRAAIKHLSEQLEDQQQLNESAELYAELYETDDEMRELTESALSGWPK
jgi:Arc/MetJ-type ribon-helix-helix transcriptional regulator